MTWLNRGGAELWLMHMVRAVARSKWAMDVCCKGTHCGAMAPEARAIGAAVIHCPLPFYVGGFVGRLTRILKTGKYDLLHTHMGAHSALAVRAARQAGIPVISTFHNTAYPPQTSLTMLPFVRHARSIYAARSIRYTLKHSNLVTAVSKGVAHSLVRYGPEPPNPIRVSYLGVPSPEPLRPDAQASLRASLQLELHDKVLLHVGRFLAAKNHRGLIEIFDLVRRRVPNAVLVLAGDGPLRPDIEAMVRARKIEHSVRFLGIREDVSSLMQISDVLAMPSHHEGLPLVVMEAGAVGLPIVASNIPGIVEGVADGESALLHDVSDIAGMADSVCSLLKSDELRQACSDHAREHYLRHFSVDSAANRLVQLYEEVLA